MINGIIVINKEIDFTSHDVVAKMRGIAGQKKVGHTGTLDPQATGVLPVCLGKATKVSDLLTGQSKEYRATLTLGKTSDTQDIWGKILEEKQVQLSQQQIYDVIHSFIGDSMQIPPMYSALKQNGKKLYELAREGKVVEREARKIHIDYITIEEICLPEVTFLVSCSKGTYIRTLCYDIGEKLGCGGLMSSLCRTRVGQFTLEHAHTLSEAQGYKELGNLESIVYPIDSIFKELNKIHVLASADKWLTNGNILRMDQTVEGIGKNLKNCYEANEELLVYDSQNEFQAMYEADYKRGLFVPKKMF